MIEGVRARRTPAEVEASRTDGVRWLMDRTRAGAWSFLARADGASNRLYGSRLNPLYHTGALVVLMLVVLLVTGLYLLLFYRVGAPYESVARITDQAWAGRWIRGLHRYAADLAIPVVALHAFRMWVQGRSWGPRLLAWVSGLVLVFLLFVCGWTGYVMIWDAQAQLLAEEGARLIDVVPIFSEPIGRAFVGERPLPSAFFFLNLFLHIALPVGAGLVLWVHVARIARPKLLPPRRLLWGTVGLLTLLALVWPVGMAAEADLFRLPDDVVLDLFYGFWLPVTRLLPAGAVWAGGVALGIVVVLVPLWSRPPAEARPAPSVVDERVCTGCEQCYHDCPYEAIRMVERTDGRAGLVASIDASLCVSCGICVGSCAPMVVGPPGRTGRDQFAAARAFLENGPGRSDPVVVVGCERSAVGSAERFDGSRVFGVSCIGGLHTSTVEQLLRGDPDGVLIVACPVGDCWNREGVRWAAERLFEGREAELQERVDRRRIRLVEASATDVATVRRELARLRGVTRRLPGAEPGPTELDCERPAAVRSGTAVS